MSTPTPTQTRLLAAAAAAGKLGLTRVRGGYSAGLPPKCEVFTIRTCRAAERDGLVEFRGAVSDVLRLTRKGLEAASGAGHREARQ